MSADDLTKKLESIISNHVQEKFGNTSDPQYQLKLRYDIGRVFQTKNKLVEKFSNDTARAVSLGTLKLKPPQPKTDPKEEITKLMTGFRPMLLSVKDKVPNDFLYCLITIDDKKEIMKFIN